MIAVGMAVVWFVIVSLALVCCAHIERHNRFRRLVHRPDLDSPRAEWGFDSAPPPSAYIFARALAGGARLVRSHAVVLDRSAGLWVLGRIASCVALASALSLIPFAGTWGGDPNGLPLVAVDLRFGLLAVVFFILMLSMAQVAVGLADRNIWSRFGSARIAGRALGGLGLLILVLAPLALETDSFRLHEIAIAQQMTFAPFASLPAIFPSDVLDLVRGWRWPSWNLFSQPLTALLFVFTLRWLLRRPSAEDVDAGIIATAGFGLDSNPHELYWERMEARLVKVLAASLFVSLFLGAAGIPYLSALSVIAPLEALVGFELPAFLWTLLQVAVFFGKLLLVLVLGARLQRVSATLRSDQWIGLGTMRLVPLAWANLLLVSAISLLSSSVEKGIQ